MSVGIYAYDHVGIRVADRDESVAFYQRLGFEPVPHLYPPRLRALAFPDAESWARLKALSPSPRP